MRKILGSEFFNRPTRTVARELLGKYLVRKVGSKTIALMINETEAYDGFKDKASHAHRGQTPRNTPMFGEPGHIYVYFTYGIHWMLNLVCGKPGYPAAVLVRGAGEVVGPARLTKALGIDKVLSAKPLSKKSGLWIEDRGVVVRPRNVSRTPRIGIRYAEEYVEKPWRFVLKKEHPVR
jgi:DNA-3-methyladenine glycosylase